ncbi:MULTISPECIES: M81 family metallopeptidase [unclassified Halanaerobium]|uniref:M81 family metallopeptidase n=1 Tax=unclassified Halanaerobium TaxID=2641197 RepID=UPI000DF27836|nr:MULTISPECIES: M81 family metallopeptidase [unclassified Halanaerobium]RCW41554.1 microcystin degradation protein MlrC [Halanaerobium sp. MA284_MarDTE_T2]RCW81128.1 microcystin degradation protein MlrC [Halanaerobium sp. DL-01]
MKILVGMIHHESNSFNPELTELDEFKILKGEEVLENRDMYSHSSLKGIMETLKKNKFEIVPTAVFLPTSEGGLVSDGAYQKIKKIYINEMEKHKDIDGVCLALHGSMTTESHLDVEGDILSETRAFFGDDVWITAAVDMHAMITDKMIKNADGLTAYRTAPHVDKYETGVRAADMLLKALKENIELKMSGVKIPYLVSGEKSEGSKYPMNELLKKLELVDKKEKVLNSSFCLGFPWSDVKFNTVSALVVTEESKKIADQEAKYLARLFWDKRYDFKFTTPAYSLSESLKIAAAEDDSPVFIIDSGDNPGAGSSQKIVEPLIYLTENNFKNVLYGSVCDREVVDLLSEAGPGVRKDIYLGQKNSDPKSGKVKFCCKVKKIRYYKGIKSVLTDIDGIDVIISNQKVVMTDPEFVFNFDIKLDNYKIIMFKSGYLAPEYQPYSKKTLLALTPGYTYQELEKLPYKNVKRPIFPVDKIDKIEFETFC